MCVNKKNIRTQTAYQQRRNSLGTSFMHLGLENI